MLHGIDVSGWQGWPFGSYVQSAYDESDFVIAKASQGTGIVSTNTVAVIEQALADGKLVGTYHYAGGGKAAEEAAHYWAKVKQWSGQAIACLDFERYQNAANWNDTTWAERFCAAYYDLSGVWPLVYTSAYCLSKVASCAEHCRLWVAGYPSTKLESWEPPTYSYPTGAWDSWTIWQYTNSAGKLDRDVCNLTATGWHALAVGEEVPGSTDAELARQVIDGAFGNGAARRRALGSRYRDVQKLVNALLTESDSELACRVMTGELGNGSVRKYVLGNRYASVQQIVNQIVAQKC